MKYLHGALIVAGILALSSVAYGVLRLTPAAERFLAATAPPPAVWLSANQIPGIVDRRLGDALTEIKALRVAVDRQTTGVRADIRGIAGKLDAPLDKFGTAIEHVSGIREDLQPTLAHVASVTAQVDDAAPLFLDCDHNADCAFNRFQGTSKAIEQSAQNFGKASADVSAALPQTLFGIGQIVSNSDHATEAAARASDATARTMNNLATATKPLPTWARVALAVAPPLVSVGATVVTTLAVTGK